ncbi:hypothetical protein K4043_05085 [Stenotrophomonas sp. SRS1]|uniref:P-loop ATPase, Sll1717 family n=1 Tax=Stenotrophomonas sp. SRS1 TaxID=2870345 RepID=UPI0022377868|nr:hypothetical protein [Stenotrophomonas sp. SRS1]MCW6027383.1 hypothetical protein [Stenotrophomonas sp. SRS1]
MTTSFKPIDWGQDFAKGDTKLRDYFVHFPEFSEVVDGSKRYVIGRKGAGKTAVIEKLRLEQDSDALKFNADITLRDFPLNDMQELADKSHSDKGRYVSAWMFIIYVELAKIISKDNGAGPSQAVMELKEFLSFNDLDSTLGFISTVEKLKSKKSKVSVLPKWAGGEVENGNTQTTRLSVHFRKIVSSLEGLLRQVQSESEYWLFVDELDEGYRAGAPSLRLILLALIRAIEDSSLAMKRSNLKFRPLLVLRTDIFDALEDNDLNKLDDFVVRLRWTSDDTSSEHSLMRIADERIRLQYPGIIDAWNEVTINQDNELPREVKSLWQYMTSRTFDRPRDLIKFLKYCSRHSKPDERLSFSTVKSAEADYSNWFRNEIRDEIHSYFPIWQECFQAISRLGLGKISEDSLVDELSQDEAIFTWMTSNSKSAKHIINLLFDFGILGYHEGRRWIFKHKDDDLTRKSGSDLIVHYGLYKKLRLRFGK